MQTMSSMLDSVPLDFEMPSSLPTVIAPTMPNIPAPKTQPIQKPPAANIVKPVPKNPIFPNKNLGFSNLPDLPSVPTDIPIGDIKEKDDDEETDFDELLNRFEDLKKNKK